MTQQSAAHEATELHWITKCYAAESLFFAIVTESFSVVFLAKKLHKAQKATQDASDIIILLSQKNCALRKTRYFIFFGNLCIPAIILGNFQARWS